MRLKSTAKAVRQASRSDAQARAESLMRDLLGKELGCDGLIKRRFTLQSGAHLEIDAYSDQANYPVLAECFAHIGKLKSAQKAKVAKD